MIKLLFVEDDPWVSYFYREALEAAGFSADIARDPQSAITELRPPRRLLKEIRRVFHAFFEATPCLQAPPIPTSLSAELCAHHR